MTFNRFCPPPFVESRLQWNKWYAHFHLSHCSSAISMVFSPWNVDAQRFHWRSSLDFPNEWIINLCNRWILFGIEKLPWTSRRFLSIFWFLVGNIEVIGWPILTQQSHTFDCSAILLLHWRLYGRQEWCHRSWPRGACNFLNYVYKPTCKFRTFACLTIWVVWENVCANCASPVVFLMGKFSGRSGSGRSLLSLPEIVAQILHTMSRCFRRVLIIWCQFLSVFGWIFCWTREECFTW